MAAHDTDPHPNGAVTPRILEIAFDADDDTAAWLFEQITDLVQHTEDIIDPVVALRPDERPEGDRVETPTVAAPTSGEARVAGLMDALFDAVETAKADRKPARTGDAAPPAA